jgi:hypothetical protein
MNEIICDLVRESTVIGLNHRHDCINIDIFRNYTSVEEKVSGFSSIYFH